MSESPDLLKADEVAKRLRVSVATVYRFARAGTLPSIRVGNVVRFPSEAIDARLAEQQEAAAS